MIAVDTNVLLRLIVADDAAQAAKARVLFDAAADAGESLWVADVVLAELVWALDRSYRRPRADIVMALRALARNATVCLEAAACLAEAVALYERGPADFVDCLLAVRARSAGCGALRSFDRKMRALPGFELL